MQRLIAQAFDPIRHERAMGRTRSWILRYARPGAKNRDTKSQSFPGADAITSNVSSNAMAWKSGRGPRKSNTPFAAR